MNPDPHALSTTPINADLHPKQEWTGALQCKHCDFNASMRLVSMTEQGGLACLPMHVRVCVRVCVCVCVSMNMSACADYEHTLHI